MFDGRQYAQAKTTAWDRENTKPNPIWNMCHINRILVNQYRIAIAWNVILTGCLPNIPNPKTINNNWFLWKNGTTSLYSLVLSSFTETNNMDVTNRVAFSRVKWMTTDTKQSKICKNLPRFIFKVMLFFDCYTEGSGPVVHMLTSWCFFCHQFANIFPSQIGNRISTFFLWGKHSLKPPAQNIVTQLLSIQARPLHIFFELPPPSGSLMTRKRVWKAPASCKLDDNSYKWPWNWVTEVITPYRDRGPTTPLITYTWWRGPPSRNLFSKQVDRVCQVALCLTLGRLLQWNFAWGPFLEINLQT